MCMRIVPSAELRPCSIALLTASLTAKVKSKRSCFPRPKPAAAASAKRRAVRSSDGSARRSSARSIESEPVAEECTSGCAGECGERGVCGGVDGELPVEADDLEDPQQV